MNIINKTKLRDKHCMVHKMTNTRLLMVSSRHPHRPGNRPQLPSPFSHTSSGHIYTHKPSYISHQQSWVYRTSLHISYHIISYPKVFVLFVFTMKSNHTSPPTSPLASFGKFFRQLASPSTKSPPLDRDGSNHGAKCVSYSAPLYSEIHRVFDYFDENGDGKITASELQNRLRKVGGEESQLSDEEAEMVVRTSDADGDGVLGLEDFAKMMEGEGEGEGEEELREAFGMYSTAEGSVITPKSLKRMLSRLGQSNTMSDCKVMIDKFDVNGDGVLDFNEFRAMMR